ncbi:MAG: glycosyltransferase family 2 protein [Verrucomicrobiota bacterium]
MLTVGVPVFNAERFLERCLTNLCAEDFDFRILIADNASTDKTGEIAQAFALKDNRIRYIRHESNIGGGKNFLFLLDAADTELFAWRAYDDISTLGYFQRLSEALERQPQCNLAVGSLNYEVEQGTTPAWHTVIDALPADPGQRRNKLLTIAEVTWFYGVFRRRNLLNRYVAAQNAYDFVWSFDPLVLLPFVLEASVCTVPSVVFTQYVCGGSAASYRPKGVIASSRLISQFWRYGFSIADEISTSLPQRIRLKTDVIRYTNKYGLKYSRVVKRALLWPYYRLTDRL